MTTASFGGVGGSLGRYPDRYGYKGGMLPFYAPALFASAAALMLTCVALSTVAILARPQLVAEGQAGESLILHESGTGGYVLWADFTNPAHDGYSLSCKTSTPEGGSHVYGSGRMLFARDLGDTGWTAASEMRDVKDGEVMVCTGDGLRGARVTRDDWIWAFPVAVGTGLLGAVVLPVSLVGMRMRRRALPGSQAPPGL